MSHQKKAALIVEDEKEIQDQFSVVLENEGFSVVRAGNSHEARMKMNMQSFDVMVININLPGENGIKFINALRTEIASRQKLPPLVLLSATELAQEQKSKILKTLGIDLLLQQPFDMDSFKDFIVTKILGRVNAQSYDLETINAFLTATVQTITLNTHVAPVKENPIMRKDATSFGEFTGVINLVGKGLRGAVAISFERKCLEGVARSMFQDESMDVPDAMLGDMAGEMCNQVAGGAQAIFQKGGMRFEISTPTLVTGQGHQITHKLAAPCLILPFKWKDSHLYTEFVLVKDSSSEEASADANDDEKNSLDSGDVNFF